MTRIAKRVSRNQGFPPPLVRAGRRGESFVLPDGRRGGFRDGRDGGGFLPDGLDGLTGGLGPLAGGLGLGGRRPGGRGPILELNGLLLSVTFSATSVFRVLHCRSQAGLRQRLRLGLAEAPARRRTARAHCSRWSQKQIQRRRRPVSSHQARTVPRAFYSSNTLATFHS